jgi:hypothetical protein
MAKATQVVAVKENPKKLNANFVVPIFIIIDSSEVKKSSFLSELLHLSLVSLRHDIAIQINLET